MIDLLLASQRAINAFNHYLGRMVSWSSLLLVLLVFVIALMRYVLKLGSIPLQETVIYLHGILFMLGASYTLACDEHVRVDVLYSNFSRNRKAWVNLFGVVVFLWPTCGFIFYASLDFVSLSWRIGEQSSEVDGLPYLYLLKSLILIMPVLVALQGLAMVLKSTLILIGRESTDG